MNPLSVKHNNYHKNKKNSTIFTPIGVAQFLYDILRPVVRCQKTIWHTVYNGIILDPLWVQVILLILVIMMLVAIL